MTQGRVISEADLLRRRNDPGRPRPHRRTAHPRRASVTAEAVIIDRAELPVYLRIAEKAKHLRDLGMSDKTIARTLGVSDETVGKAVSVPLSSFRPDPGFRGPREIAPTKRSKPGEVQGGGGSLRAALLG